MIDLLIPTVAQGLLWAVMALGVYVTFRVLDIADLTVEGSFPLGAATAASLMVAGYGPLTALFIAFLAGTLSGVVTGLLHTKMKIPALLAGILTMIALYSVNLRVMGKANLSLGIEYGTNHLDCGSCCNDNRRRLYVLVFWYPNWCSHSCYRL